MGISVARGASNLASPADAAAAVFVDAMSIQSMFAVEPKVRLVTQGVKSERGKNTKQLK